MKFALRSLVAAALAAGAVAGQAAVVQIDGANPIIAGATPITFGEVALGSANPTIGSVSFGSFFVGQSLGDITSCGGVVTNCVVGSPTGTLALASGGTAATVTDPAFASNPVLGGSLDFVLGNPIAMLFADPVSAVSFLAGGFNNIGNTRVRAYSSTGALLAEIFNPGVCPPGNTCPPDLIDPSFFTFAFSSTDASGNPFNDIAGLLISVVGMEEFGFNIDNVRTVVSSANGGGPGTDPNPPGGQVPEPTSLALVGLALLGLGISRRRRSA